MKSRSQDKETQQLLIELGFIEGLERRLPNDAKILKVLGDLYTRCKRFPEGLCVDEKLSLICPGESEVWYNLGCSYSLVGRTDDAFDALNKAVELGYDDYGWILRDEDLDNIKNDPRFQLLVDRVVS